MQAAVLAASHAGSWAHPQKGSIVSSKVFVGNLEFSTPRDQLEELFAEALGRRRVSTLRPRHR